MKGRRTETKHKDKKIKKKVKVVVCVCVGNNIKSLLVISPVNTRYCTLHPHPY